MNTRKRISPKTQRIMQVLAGLACIAIGFVISTKLLLDKFGSYGTYIEYNFKPIERMQMLMSIWNDNFLLSLLGLVLIMTGAIWLLNLKLR